MVPRYYNMLRLCHVCASKCISWALAGTAYAAGHKTEMRLSASFEVLSGLIPFRSDHVLSGVASTILDGEVSTVSSLSQKSLALQSGRLVYKLMYLSGPSAAAVVSCTCYVSVVFLLSCCICRVCCYFVICCSCWSSGRC